MLPEDQSWGPAIPSCCGSTLVMESSDISIMDCWNSRGMSPFCNAPGVGVGAPTVPYSEAPFSRCLAYVESAYAWKEHLDKNSINTQVNN